MRGLLDPSVGAQHDHVVGSRGRVQRHAQHVGEVPQGHRGLRQRQLRHLPGMREVLGGRVEGNDRAARWYVGGAAGQRRVARHRLAGLGVLGGQVWVVEDPDGPQVVAALHSRDSGRRHRHQVLGHDLEGHVGRWLGSGQFGVRQRRRLAAEVAPGHAEGGLQVLVRLRERGGRRRGEGPHHGPREEVEEGPVDLGVAGRQVGHDDGGQGRSVQGPARGSLQGWQALG
mmetsp:Transcript_62780/g.175482  ORF Transcript_62780/g.175482 Transcript_62780/m.175482 type:complete len:228 (-) Transcript_62780:198-881(-)